MMTSKMKRTKIAPVEVYTPATPDIPASPFRLICTIIRQRGLSRLCICPGSMKLGGEPLTQTYSL